MKSHKFHVITDHKALEWIKKKDNFGNARIQRWLDTLQEYDFTLEYRDGDLMGEAEALSRQYGEIEIPCMTQAQQDMINHAHESVGHRSVEATLYELRTKSTIWPKQKDHVVKVLSQCERYIRNKVKIKGGCEFIETKYRL